MKNRLIALWVLCFVGWAQAQLSVPISQAQAQGEQMRINEARAGLERQYATQEAACYQRFAVTDCLRELRARKRVSLETLRRQEIVLNDLQRKTRALEQASQAQEKTSPEALKAEADRREAALIQHKERMERAQQKKTDASVKASQADAHASQRAQSQGSKTQSSPSKGASTQAQQAYEEKQRIAQERKAQRDKSLAEKAAKPVSPLPSKP